MKAKYKVGQLVRYGRAPFVQRCRLVEYRGRGLWAARQFENGAIICRFEYELAIVPDDEQSFTERMQQKRIGVR